MSKTKSFPLHYQILIAMIAGAAIGLLVNPGQFALDDVDVVIKKSNAKIELTMRPTSNADARPVYQKSFPSLDAFRKQFPDLADNVEKSAGKTPLTFSVTNRRVYLSENGKKITLRYLRQLDARERESVTEFSATSLDKLVAEHPQWKAEYAQAIKPYENHVVRRISVSAKFLGDLFLRMLRMITIPLIVTSLVVGVSGLGTSSRLGSMFGRTMLYYVCTSLLAITTGIILVNIIKPGIGRELPGGGGGAVAAAGEQSLGSVFANLTNNMIPPNPIHAMANGEFLSIITFSILVGLFIIRVGGPSGKTLRDLFQSGFDVMMSMTQFIIRLAPVGVFAFMLYATASQGYQVFVLFFWYMVTVFLALLVHAVVILPLILYFVAKRSPWEYAKAMSPALLTAFSTASSNGTLPLTITSVEERAGVSNRVSSFVLPLGATINMDGTALYEAVAVLFIAQSYTGGLPIDQQIIVAVTALLASVGAAGIPSAGLVMMTIVLDAVGLPLQAVGLIIAVDRVLDMCRTSVNVWSDSCGCAVLQRFEKPELEPSPIPESSPVD